MFENARAVIIAVNAYMDANITDLSFACNDAHALRGQLLENGFREENIVMIADGDGGGATRARIYDAVVQLARDLRASPKKLSDLVLIFFSGHSWFEEDVFDLSPFEETPPGEEVRPSQRVHYLLPYDTQLNNLSGSAIPLEYFKHMVNNLRARQVALLLDACYSGIKGHRGMGGQLADVESLIMNGLGEGRVVIASSKGDQPSWEYKDLGNGAFTYFLLEALRGKAACDEKGMINHDAVGKYVHEKVVTYSRQKGLVVQTPNWKTEIEAPPGVVLAVNPEAYFLNSIGYPQKDRYLGDRVKLALQANAADDRIDLKEIKTQVAKYIGNRIDLQSLMIEIQKIDHAYLTNLKDDGRIDEIHFDRIVSSMADPNITTANGEINRLTQKFLCTEIELLTFISQIDATDIEYIKNIKGLPFSPEVCASFCAQWSDQNGQINIQPEVQQVLQEVHNILRQICAGKIDSPEGQRKIIAIARKAIAKRYLTGGPYYDAFYAVLGWSQFTFEPVTNLIRWIWQILLGDIDPNLPRNEQLINFAIEEFEALSGMFQQKFILADQAVKNAQYETATRLFSELAQAGCPPPEILFGDTWKDRRRQLSLKAELRELAAQGKYGEIAQALGNVEPVFRFAKKLQDIAKKGYLSDSPLPSLEDQDPYTVLAEHGIDFYTPQKKIKELMVPEQQAHNALRFIEKRLFTDWQFYPVSDPDFLRKFAVDAEKQLSPPSFEQLRKLANDANISDIFIILIVAEAREQAHLFLEEMLLARPIPIRYGRLCHLLGLSYFAGAINSGSIKDKTTLNQFHRAIAYLTINLVDDAFWDQFKQRRQEVYGVDIEKVNVGKVRKELKAAINSWFVQRADACRSSGQAHDAEIYDELRLKFNAEMTGAELLKKVGGIPLGENTEQNFIGGYLGVEFFRVQDRLEEIVSQEDVPNLSLEERKLFPCLFSEYNASLILRDENPGEALQQINFVLESPDHPRSLVFVQLAVDTEIQIAFDRIGAANFSNRESAEAVEHWKRAHALSARIDKQDVTRLRIIDQVVGRVRHFQEKSEKLTASGRFREAVTTDQIGISLVEAILGQLFDSPQDRDYAKSRLIPQLASLYMDIGVELCNRADDYTQGARYLRRALELNPFSTRIREEFLRALFNAADDLLLRNRKAESLILYREAKTVAEIGEQQTGSRTFTEYKERAEHGIEGKIDIPTYPK